MKILPYIVCNIYHGCVCAHLCVSYLYILCVISIKYDFLCVCVYACVRVIPPPPSPCLSAKHDVQRIIASKLRSNV